MDRLTIASPSSQPETAANQNIDRVHALFEPLLAHQRILRQIIELKLSNWLSFALLDLRDPQTVRDRALARHQGLPARKTLHAWDDELCRALEGKADKKTLSLLLSIMLDGFPQAKTPSIDIYVDGALLLISGEQLSPQIVAAAISRVWRKNRFPPSISEVLDECSEMTKAATTTRRVITKMIALRDNAEDALVATGDLPEVPSSYRPCVNGGDKLCQVAA
jgi:hypothetical protein